MPYPIQNLDDLIKNNDHPPNEALAEVKQLLSGPWKQLDETNAKIRHLEDLIQELKQKKAEIEQSINRYSRILAPIRRVPPDILHTIFEHRLPTHRNPNMGSSECSVLLTRVCSTWRSLLLASPCLWARIHIPFLTEGSVYSEYPGHPAFSSDEVSDILQLRCHAAREWLSRSGDCSLSISISFASPGFDDQQPDKTTMLLLESVILFSSRWRNLELHVPWMYTSSWKRCYPVVLF